MKDKEEPGLLVMAGEPLYEKWKSIMPFLLVLTKMLFPLHV